MITLSPYKLKNKLRQVCLELIQPFFIYLILLCTADNAAAGAADLADLRQVFARPAARPLPRPRGLPRRAGLRLSVQVYTYVADH